MVKAATPQGAVLEPGFLPGLGAAIDPNSARLRALLLGDPLRLQCLMAARQVMLEAGIADYLLAAGFVRNAVWDSLHGRPLSPPEDIDLIYLGDGEPKSKQQEQQFTTALTGLLAVNWQVKDQRRMHLRHGDLPYPDLTAAMAAWPEQETAVGVRLTACGTLEIASSWGLGSLFSLRLTPSPLRSREQFQHRVRAKEWLGRYPQLRIAAI